VVEDKAVKVFDAMSPKPFGAITVGHMDTRSRTTAQPAVQLAGYRDMMSQQLLQTQKGAKIGTKVGI
jgi:hypothetical protein